MGAEPVRLTVVSSELEAEEICSMLRAEGIESYQRATELSGAAFGAGNWTEVLVAGGDLARARELLGPAT